MAQADANSTRGELLAEAFKTYAAEAGGHLALAKDRLGADIVSGRVLMRGENRDGTPFELPPGCSWRKAAYDFRRSAAGWLVGPKPVSANPLAGKVRPADTRKKVVAYAVRLTPTQFEAAAPTVTQASESPQPGREIDTTKPRKKRQADRVARALKTLYPPDGLVPESMPTESVRGQVAAALSGENKQLKLTDPDWKTVNRVLGRE